MNLEKSLQPGEQILWQAKERIYVVGSNLKGLITFSLCSSIMFMTFIIIFIDFNFLLIFFVFLFCIVDQMLLKWFRRKSTRNPQLTSDEYFLTNKRIGISNKGEVNTIVDLPNVRMIDITQTISKVFVKFYLNAYDTKPMFEYKLTRNAIEVDELLNALHSLILLIQEYLEGGVRFVREQN